MKRDKILLNVDNLESIEKYEKLGISNFLFPLASYSVGYSSFSYEEIANTKVNAYVLVNRLLTDDDIDAFLKLEIPQNIRGFVIEDTGIYMELANRGYTLICFQNHLNANYKTCQYWLNYYDSLVLSTDITENEIETILANATKPLVLYTFGIPMIMYSRRKLVSNYYEAFDLGEKREVRIEDPRGDFEFKLKETEYGTACFDSKILDARSSLDKFEDSKILFYLVDTSGIEFEDVVKAIEDEYVENTTRGFLDKKTVYRIGDLK